MAMVLEYPFKVFLYIIVILILVGIMWGFRDKIFGICLFGCEPDDERCDTRTVASSEDYVDQAQIDNYCQLCWEKNNFGNCTDNVLCYTISSDYGVRTGAVSTLEYCELSCSVSDAHTVFVQYDYLRQKVTLTC